MLRSLTALVAAAVMAGACGGGAPAEPPGPPPFNPTGAYDFAVGMDGQEIYGLLTIEGSVEDGYTGSVESEMGGASITNVQVDDATRTITFSIPDAEATASIVVDGSEFSGSLNGAMGSMSFYGTKRAP
jgi:hypothetical protein